MQVRRVVVTIELETDYPIKDLKRVFRSELDDLGVVKKVQVNVVKA